MRAISNDRKLLEDGQFDGSWSISASSPQIQRYAENFCMNLERYMKDSLDYRVFPRYMNCSRERKRYRIPFQKLKHENNIPKYVTKHVGHIVKESFLSVVMASKIVESPCLQSNQNYFTLPTSKSFEQKRR